MKDLPHVVKQCKVKQYADDTTLYCSCDEPASLQCSLVNDVTEVSKWVTRNRLMINVNKSQMLLLSHRGRAKELEEVKVVLNGQNIPRRSSVRYLGVTVDDKFRWKEQRAAVRRKCFSGLSQLCKLRDVLPVSTKVKLYNALVLPHTDYCSEVWHECGVVQQRQVERIQNYGMRLILGKPPPEHRAVNFVHI